MHIAQIAPLVESVPPQLYGGTERIVSYLTEELVRQGHNVTLFASGDSQTKGELVATAAQALRLDPNVDDVLANSVLQLEQLRQRANEFDIIHFHSDLLHLAIARTLGIGRTVTTMHGRVDLRDYKSLLGEFSDAPLVSISDDQRLPLPEANWVGTVYHGLPLDVCRASTSQGQYAAFLGRIAPEKRVDRAIEIARRADVPLKIAAKVDEVDKEYFHAHIESLLSEPHVEFVGEISDAEKSDFLGNALALLFPIDWPEPFGLVLIEAMACGTPCIAWRAGSVPEVVEEGVTGRIVDSIEVAVDALRHIATLDRLKVRERFEERFSVQRMASDYLKIYRQLLNGLTDYAAGSRAHALTRGDGHGD